jgi:anti-sigma B factor antagonist
MLHATPLTINRKQGKTEDTCIFGLTGPLILRNMFELQSALRGKQQPRLTVLDLAGVPYVDSAGLGLLVNHFVHCQSKGARLVVTGANSRVLDLFKITRVDGVLPLAATVEDAEADA